MIHVLDHGEVLARPISEKHKLLGYEPCGESSETRILSLLSSLTELAMAAGADLVYCLPLGGLKPPASAGSFEHATVFFDA
jgi:hypothetical protein